MNYTGKNDVETAIMGRRSIKKFTTDPVDIEELIELLNVAKWAPNHKLTEPWRFQLYADKGKEKFIEAFLASQERDGSVPDKAKNKANYFRDIPLHLVVIMPEDPRKKRWDEDYAAISAMVQNFQLAAWERGIGMIWRTNDWTHDPVFKEAIGVKEDEKIVGTLMIGYPKHVPKPEQRADIRNVLTIIDE
ncbi:nitroreductase [Sporosarcina sp. P37]|uniref:nitroreductase family protein n=1 Tax=unclassified Sporosarcina TaxID=2647733 RepID=UPI0009BEEA68|nr:MULTISPECIES: nitroreductase [unclassified Sporosarcina]ARD48509.1 nitroreductase [Sporosarcina sp. P33]ARK25013.1 nitroreductase [Sporosarcina sp. P37]PID18159.1 nitroreductase [Sporosarcina sp. P35]